MEKTLNILKPYFAYIIIGFMALMLFLLMLFWPNKEFPVKVGQIWECTMKVIPYARNIPQAEVVRTSYDSVYRIDEDGTIYYIENGTDSMFANLETFTFKSKMLKDRK
jgi:hypothetical protein